MICGNYCVLGLCACLGRMSARWPREALRDAGEADCVVIRGEVAGWIGSPMTHWI